MYNNQQGLINCKLAREIKIGLGIFKFEIAAALILSLLVADTEAVRPFKNRCRYNSNTKLPTSEYKFLNSVPTERPFEKLLAEARRLRRPANFQHPTS